MGSKKPAIHEPWYADGLKFKCTQCGNCCSGDPGYVFVTRREMAMIAQFIGRGEEGLDEQHVHRVDSRYSLTEDRKTGDCCFLERTSDGKRICGIYPVRPMQCRTWPFWPVILESPETWEEAARDCPGMNQGTRHKLEYIQIRRKARRWEDLGS